MSRTGLLTVDNEGIKGGTLTENTTFRYNWVPRPPLEPVTGPNPQASVAGPPPAHRAPARSMRLV